MIRSDNWKGKRHGILLIKQIANCSGIFQARRASFPSLTSRNQQKSAENIVKKYTQKMLMIHDYMYMKKELNANTKQRHETGGC